MGILFYILFSFSSPEALAGARIYFDLNQATATITAEMNYFGEIREDVLRKASDIIAHQWQGEPTRPGDTTLYPLALIFKGRLKVSTRITTRFVPSIEIAKEEMSKNDAIEKNYFRVLAEPNEHFDSSVTGLGVNAGVLLYSDLLDTSTTAAHEFGHTLGLEHTKNMDGLTGYPPIMLERGRFPNQPIYAYDPNNPQSSVNPIYRRVRQFELDSIDLSDPTEFSENDPARIQSMNMVKVIYTSNDRTKGYLDLGYWFLMKKDNPIFK